jgi:hypothetical protein
MWRLGVAPLTLAVVLGRGAGCEEDVIVTCDSTDLFDSGPVLDGPMDLQPGSDADGGEPEGWAIAVGGAGADEIWNVVRDGSGNLIVLGRFGGTMTLEGVSGDITLTGPPSTETSGGRTFIAKLDPAARKWLWAVDLDGEPVREDTGQDGLGVDATGNIYHAGTFTGTVTFGTNTLTSAGGLDLFVSKLDPDGQPLWARSVGGPGDDDANDVALGDDGTLTICGQFSDTVSFGATTLTAQGSNDLYVARLDQTDGSFDWATRAGSASTEIQSEYAQSIALDDAGNVYVAGAAGGGAVFGPASHELSGEAGKERAYVAKVEADGTFALLVGLEGQRSRGVALGPSDTIYVTSGSRAVLSAGWEPEWDNFSFVTKVIELKANWLIEAGWPAYAISPQVCATTHILVDAKGNSVVAGWFAGKTQFGGTRLNSGAAEAFLARLDPEGHFVSAEPVAGQPLAGDSVQQSLAIRMVRDATGGLYVVGRFMGSSDFGGVDLTSHGFDPTNQSSATLDGFIWYTGRGLE